MDELICSARRCRETAVWALKWNNPAIHEPEYRKIWLACYAHRDTLDDFLADRGYPAEIVPVSEL